MNHQKYQNNEGIVKIMARKVKHNLKAVDMIQEQFKFKNVATLMFPLKLSAGSLSPECIKTQKNAQWQLCYTVSYQMSVFSTSYKVPNLTKLNKKFNKKQYDIAVCQ